MPNATPHCDLHNPRTVIYGSFRLPPQDAFRQAPGRAVMISEPLHESFPVPIGMYSERFMA